MRRWRTSHAAKPPYKGERQQRLLLQGILFPTKRQHLTALDTYGVQYAEHLHKNKTTNPLKKNPLALPFKKNTLPHTISPQFLRL